MQSARVSIHLHFRTQKIPKFSMGQRRVTTRFLLHVLYYRLLLDINCILPSKPPSLPTIFKMKATVQIHRAQQSYICSTHDTLYKLDMNNSTDALPSPLHPMESSYNGYTTCHVQSDSIEQCFLALAQYF